MSLINDALKRAQQAQQAQEKQAQAPPAEPVPLPAAPARRFSFLWPLAFLCLVLAAVLAMFGISYLRKTLPQASALDATGHTTAPPPSLTTPQPALPDEAVVVAPLPAPAPVTTPASQAVVAQDSTPAPILHVTERSGAVVVPMPPSDTAANPPDLRLQGILYRTDMPAAIINGRSVYVGDHVEDGQGEGTIKAITPNSVTVLWEGRLIQLRL